MTIFVNGLTKQVRPVSVIIVDADRPFYQMGQLHPGGFKMQMHFETLSLTIFFNHVGYSFFKIGHVRNIFQDLAILHKDKSGCFGII